MGCACAPNTEPDCGAVCADAPNNDPPVLEVACPPKIDAVVEVFGTGAPKIEPAALAP